MSVDLHKDYLFKLAVSLREEVLQACQRAAGLQKLLPGLDCFIKKLDSISLKLGPELFIDLFHQYAHINYEKAGILNNASTLSRPYHSLQEFWSDAECQSHGLSPFTFWDTYEHGRRRQIEKLLAITYGSESALLLNSGMSAINVALEMCNLSSGDCILTTYKNYFETTDYLESFLTKRGVEIIRCDVSDIEKCLGKYQPKILFVETVCNTPEVPVLINWDLWRSASPDTMFIFDNTIQSHLTRWFQEPFYLDDRTVVLESATKYISQDCVAGVLYGSTKIIDKARHLARSIGQNLQEKAFNYLAEGQIVHVKDRLLLHSRNAKMFFNILKEKSNSHLEYIRTLDYTTSLSPVFIQGIGCLIFLNPVCPKSRDRQETNRTLLQVWQDKCADQDIELSVRAGFGWTQTTSRVYEANALNQPDAPFYMRISVGIEPVERIQSLAFLLVDSIKECIR